MCGCQHIHWRSHRKCLFVTLLIVCEKTAASAFTTEYPVHAAVVRNDLDELHRIISRAADVNKALELVFQLILFACERGVVFYCVWVFSQSLLNFPNFIRFPFSDCNRNYDITKIRNPQLPHAQISWFWFEMYEASRPFDMDPLITHGIYIVGRLEGHPCMRRLKRVNWMWLSCCCSQGPTSRPKTRWED